MSKRGVIRVVVIWMVVAVAVTAWVTTRTERVSSGNAMLLGAAVATVLAAVLGGGRKK